MNFDLFIKSFCSLILVGFGFYIKSSKNEEKSVYQKWWKIYIVIGILSLITNIYQFYN